MVPTCLFNMNRAERKGETWVMEHCPGKPSVCRAQLYMFQISRDEHGVTGCWRASTRRNGTAKATAREWRRRLLCCLRRAEPAYVENVQRLSLWLTLNNSLIIIRLFKNNILPSELASSLFPEVTKELLMAPDFSVCPTLWKVNTQNVRVWSKKRFIDRECTSWEKGSLRNTSNPSRFTGLG